MTLTELERFDPHARSTGNQRRFLCPRCGEDKPRDMGHRSLSLDMATGLWVCHRCHAKGKLEERSEPRGRQGKGPRRAAVARSAGSTGRSVASARRVGSVGSVAATAQPPLPSALPPLLHGLQPLAGSPAAAYLEGRGIPLAVALSAAAKYHPAFLGGPAVVFAVRDAAGRLVGLQGRYLDPHASPKVRSVGPVGTGAVAIPLAGAWPRLTGVSDGVLDPTQVPNEPGAWKVDPLILVEAPIDALSLATAGWAAIAVLGCNLPDRLPRRLAFRHVLIGTDADAAGDSAADEWTGPLRGLGARVERLRPEGAVDWNALLLKHGAPAFADAVWASLQERVRRAIQDECGVRVRDFFLPRPRFEFLGEGG